VCAVHNQYIVNMPIVIYDMMFVQYFNDLCVFQMLNKYLSYNRRGGELPLLTRQFVYNIRCQIVCNFALGRCSIVLLILASLVWICDGYYLIYNGLYSLVL
jgi:hypothetical protein